MAGIEAEVAGHYARGGLVEAVEAGLRALGRDGREVTLDDLAPLDEFHMGGRQATAEFASRLGLEPGMAVLDIGSGLGGPARFLAHRHGCRVTGIDLTPDYVAVAELLTRRTGLAGQVEFRLGSALDLPFAAASFAAATLFHVGMNIPDKAVLAREAARVLRPGGRFLVYDVMRTGRGEPAYPVAWAAGAATSFLAPPASYRQALAAAGFTLEEELDRRDLALEVFARLRARSAGRGPPPLGLHLLMGPEAPAKVANMVAALERGIMAPVAMIARLPGAA